MRKQIQLLTLLFIFFHQDIIAQKSKLLDKNTLNVYSNGLSSTHSVWTTSNQNNVRSDYSGFSFGFLSFALEKQISDHLYREFEWLPIRWDYEDTETHFTNSDGEERLTNGVKSFYFETAIRYQINYYLFSLPKDKKLNPYIGLSNRANYESFIREAKIGSYESQERILGMTFQLSPGIEWKFHRQVKLVIDMPISLVSLDSRWRKVNNPPMAISEPRDQYFDFEFLRSGMNFRVGLKMDLSSGKM